MSNTKISANYIHNNQNNKQLAFLVNNLGASQLGYYMIKNINNFLKLQPKLEYDILALYENITQYCIFPDFSVMHINNLWGQEGICIATTLSTAQKLLNSTGQKKSYFYLWDLEWLRGHNPQARIYENYCQIYQNPKLKLICRSNNHARILENNFNVSPIGIVENFNISELINLCQK